MTLEIESSGDTLHLRGELDVATEGVLTDALERISQDANAVAVDLSGLEFIDSSGVRAIVRGAHALGEAGRLELRNPGPAVRRVLELMRLDSIPNIEISRAEDPRP